MDRLKFGEWPTSRLNNEFPPLLENTQSWECREDRTANSRKGKFYGHVDARKFSGLIEHLGDLERREVNSTGSLREKE